MYLSYEKLIDHCSMIIMRVFQHRDTKLANMPSVTRMLSSSGVDPANFDGKMREFAEISDSQGNVKYACTPFVSFQT